MNKGRNEPDTLRIDAEERLALMSSSSEAQECNAGELLHDLQVHQIELDMQNEALRQSLIVLEESRDRYVDFYDFAPVGYLTLTHKALIAEINLTGATLLGEERHKLLLKAFSEFVVSEDRDNWYLYLKSVLQEDRKLTCELKIQRHDGQYLYFQLDSLRLTKEGRTPLVRIVLIDITERKLAEAALRESEYHRQVLEQQKIVQASLDGFWMVNANTGKILEVNDIFCKMMGYSREEVLSMSIADLEAVETPEETYARIMRIREIGYDRFETRQYHKHGHLVDLEVSVSHSEINGGTNFAFFRDISERKQAEAFKQSILNSISAEIAVINHDGVILAVNEPWRQFALDNGVQPGTPLPGVDIGTNYFNIRTTGTETEHNDAEEAFKGIQAVLDGRLANFSIEYPCHSPRQKRWFRMSATPLGENPHTGAVITHADITEIKRAEEIVRHSRDQLKRFIQQAPISIVMLDRNLNYLSTSGRWFKEYNRGYPDLIGRNHYEVNPDIPDGWKSVHQQALAGGTFSSNDDLWILNDGSRLWLRWAVLPWIDENAEIGGIIISAENITDKKMLEMEIQERRNEMEYLQRKYVAAQTAAALAHELNQPLLAIASYSKAALMLMETELQNPDKIRKAIEGCERQALRAGESIRELLDFLSIKEFPTESFNLNNEIIQVLNVAKVEHELTFDTILRLEEGLPFVKANRIHVQKVLLNLIHNGIDAMQEAGVPLPAITVTVFTRKDGSFAQVTIQDNGPGVKKENLHKLFEPFFTTKGNGIGMGLAISRSLVEENGGQLWIESEEGNGATFHLTLPFGS